MDLIVISMVRDNKINLIIFNINELNVILRVIDGDIDYIEVIS